MRIVHLPVFWTILIDVLVWLGIHLGLSYSITQLPAETFSSESGLYKKRRWEKGGMIYERILFVRAWKGLLPEGSALFKKGFRKRKLRERNKDYFDRFVRETCRAEYAHWLTILCSPVFFLWNLSSVGIGMIVYALLANLPCIIAQRYNRIRMDTVLKSMR